MKYILVKINKTKWIVAQQGVLEGEYRAVTAPLLESTARRVFHDFLIFPSNKLPKETEALLL